MRLIHGLAPLLVLGLMAGCGGSRSIMSYDAADNQTRFRTGNMTVAQAAGSGFSNTSLAMRANAKCSGQNCTPNEVRLDFSVQGSSDFALSDRSVSITADGEEFTWEKEVEWDSSEDIGSSPGRLIAVSLSLSDVSKIANASSISGRLGNTSLDLDGRVQQKLQEFVSTAKNPAAAASAAEESSSDSGTAGNGSL